MKRSAKSYKLHEFFTTKMYFKLERGDEISTCVYFWWTALAAIQAFITGLAVLGLIILLLTPFYALFAGLTNLHFLPPVFSEVGFMFVLSMLPLALLAGLVESFKGNLKVWPKWFPVDVWFGKRPVKAVKEPGLVLAYLKAKKDKVCPLIKLEK